MKKKSFWDVTFQFFPILIKYKKKKKQKSIFLFKYSFIQVFN